MSTRSSYPLGALRQLLSADRETAYGVVIRITDGQATVATATGVQQARAIGSLSPGDAVALSRGAATRRRRPSLEYPL